VDWHNLAICFPVLILQVHQLWAQKIVEDDKVVPMRLWQRTLAIAIGFTIVFVGSRLLRR
jgi:hypothetical protein